MYLLETHYATKKYVYCVPRSELGMGDKSEVPNLKLLTFLFLKSN